MAGTRVEASLRYGGSVLPAGPTVPVDPTGLAVSLDIPPGVALLGAELSLQAPGDDVTLELVKGPPSATVVTSAAETVLPANKPAEWLTVDWGVRRPLTFLQVLADASNGRQGRLKISEGGPWFPLFPLDTLSLGDVGQPLPGVMASRVMVELVKPVDASKPVKDWMPSSTPIKDVIIRAAARPADLSAGIGKASPFFLYPLPLQPGQELLLRDELSGALREAWPEDLQGGRVDLLLRSSAPGRLRRARLSLDTASVVTAWSNGAPELRLALGPGEEVTQPLAVSTESPLRGFELAVESQLRQERVPLTPVVSSMPALAQLCDSSHEAGQAFTSPRGSVLAGVDLHLRLLSRTAKGRVSLHADVAGEPEAQPLASASMELSLEEEGNPPWKARWVSMDLPTPVPPGEAWWVVLTLSEGEVLWSLDKPPQPPVPALKPLGGLSRLEDDPWQARVLPSPAGALDQSWALCRPRFVEPASPLVPTVLLRWGTSELALEPDAEGRISLDEQALRVLKPAAQPLKVVVRSPSAGELTLSRLRVTSARSDTYALFTPT